MEPSLKSSLGFTFWQKAEVFLKMILSVYFADLKIEANRAISLLIRVKFIEFLNFIKANTVFSLIAIKIIRKMKASYKMIDEDEYPF